MRLQVSRWSADKLVVTAMMHGRAPVAVYYLGWKEKRAQHTRNMLG